MINFEKAETEKNKIEVSLELLTFAQMGSNFGKRPSELASINDPEKAFAYDMVCADYLQKIEETKYQERNQELCKTLNQQLLAQRKTLIESVKGEVITQITNEINNRGNLYELLSKIVEDNK